jgi:sirohydrochlorin ferrochelatase
MQGKTGVIVFTHGSRFKEGNAIMVRLVDQLKSQLGSDLVEPCFLELAQPDIPSAIGKLVARGCTHIFGYAFFLVPGRHLQKDIPEIIEQALARHPGVTYEISEPMMDDPGLLNLVSHRIRRALDPDETTGTH